MKGETCIPGNLIHTLAPTNRKTAIEIRAGMREFPSGPEGIIPSIQRPDMRLQLFLHAIYVPLSQAMELLMTWVKMIWPEIHDNTAA
jgi:hypothetical protein